MSLVVLGTDLLFFFSKFVLDLLINFPFSPTQPSGPSWSSSRHDRLSVRLSVCLRHHVQFFF